MKLFHSLTFNHKLIAAIKNKILSQTHWEKKNFDSHTKKNTSKVGDMSWGDHRIQRRRKMSKGAKKIEKKVS